VCWKRELTYLFYSLNKIILLFGHECSEFESISFGTIFEETPLGEYDN
jgi:hypothetical protein